tara:strand:- start:5250 stop:5462 length:213 start_codon:yes stop_codon:yes gene_type:complete
MPLKIWRNLHLPAIVDYLEEEEEEGGEYLFDPEAGKASDNPFAHLASQDAPDSAASEDEEVSKYVTGEEE